MQESPQTLARRIAAATFTLLLLALLLGGFFLARRNIRLGRGDRKGAWRVASVIFPTSSLNSLLSWPHAAQLDAAFAHFTPQVPFRLVFAPFPLLPSLRLPPHPRPPPPPLPI